MADNISLDDLKTTEATEPVGQADAEEKKPGTQVPSWKKNKPNLKPVTINEMAEAMPKEEDGPPADDDVFGNAIFKLDEGVDRYKADIKKNLIDPQMKKVAEYNQAVEAIKEEQQMDELLADAEGTTTKPNIKVAEKKDEEEALFDDDEEEKDYIIEDEAKPSSDKKIISYNEPDVPNAPLLDGLTDEEFEKAIGLDDEDEEDEEPVSSISEEEQQKRLDEFKSDIRDKIHPIKKSIDLSEFTISRKPISAAKILNAPAQVKVKTADWALLNTKRPISVSELSGVEIEKLNGNRRDRNIFNITKERYSIIYSHIVDDNKPPFEAWCKLIAYADENELFFAAYKATFEDTNIVPYGCPACNHTFMKDIPVDDMVEYPSDKTKAIVQSIRSGDTTGVGEYKAKLVQITDEYVFAIKTPSIYTAVIEPAALDQDFVNKYSDLLGVISYVDGIFVIDAANKTLIPVDYKPDRTDFVKTTKRKVVAYTKIINRFSVDQTYLLNKAITDIDEKENTLTYFAPEAVCPKCGAKIPKEERDPLSMLFTRRQLAALSNI